MGSSVPGSSAMAMEEKKAAKASGPRAGRRCTPEQRRRYYEQNIQRERQSWKAYKERSRERVMAYQRKYRAANRDKIANHVREYRVANKDKIATAKKYAPRRRT